ncbi:MAG TPA: regulatory protein RecX [Solirubrobacteraceae bacterium]|nr:regulatory protein RecX [Solirubrobacteraceae bacterium]
MSADSVRDASASLEDALARAYRFLGRRDRTVAEVRAHLLAKGVREPAAEQAIAELAEQGYLDDARFARRFAEDRRSLDSWGSERIERRLRELGVAREHVAAAVADGAQGELDDAVALLRRRFPALPGTDRDRERALGLLVRRGYELELAYDAIRALGRDAA